MTKTNCLGATCFYDNNDVIKGGKDIISKLRISIGKYANNLRNSYNQHVKVWIWLKVL